MVINSKTSLFISFGFHALLLGLFLLIKVGSSLQLPEYVQIAFAGPSVSTTRSALPARTAPPQKMGETVQPPAAAAFPQNESVRLPKRRMKEEEEPLLRVRKEEKVTIRNESAIIPQDKRRLRPEALPPGLPEQAGITGEKGVAAPADFESGQEKETPPLISGASKEANHLFKIEGEASRRRILSKVIPAYPKGYHGEGTIKLRFTVLPSGLIGDIIPILKGDAVLEKVTIDAFQQWRFAPIPKDRPQKTVVGVITFNYVLR
ncbi:transport protein TonB [bacterium BMS3Bbin03]|nr:transport protein TonB [bacterium BMS3Bbin03]